MIRTVVYGLVYVHTVVYVMRLKSIEAVVLRVVHTVAVQPRLVEHLGNMKCDDESVRDGSRHIYGTAKLRLQAF